MKLVQIHKKNYPNNLMIDFTYYSSHFYKTSIEIKEEKWNFYFKLKKFDSEFYHEEKIKFFETYKEKSEYYIIELDNKEVGWMCVGKTEWKNTARLWDLYIHKDYYRKGIGTVLINKAEEIAKNWKCRAMEIETQTSNYNAIQFYIKHGYNLSGLDSICYTNNDIEKNNVRIEFSKLLE